ncbi:uncharacterized protein LOC115623821 [Scaptodrosophila lebanonensis]|uniref:Uncharacterized protein LOC115623821 n=1 Tax=Drosophila lebanonensis TaxID=7225 RepID=A0A6J2TFL8_DROLE|nr:uncharacterized protein LOC115623821 [Scaptodrosophila lebanonensis]
MECNRAPEPEERGQHKPGQSDMLNISIVGVVELPGNHKQLGADCCRGRSLLRGVAGGAIAITAATTTVEAVEEATAVPPKSIAETHKGNELENATKLRETTKQENAFIGDITIATTPINIAATTSLPDATSLASNSIVHQLFKQAKPREQPEKFELNLRQKLALLLASEEEPPEAETIHSNTDKESSTSTTHHPERRHAVPDKLQYTKEIQIKQGRLMGITRRFQLTTGLRDVDQYLGLPYAESPIGSRRFMPPGAPLPWQGLKIARHLPPVCPQKLPDISSQSSVNMSRGRYRHLTRLMPYLKTENEDCLYLNLYVPHEELLATPRLHPVLVYLHGESFEWNSGNAYDGSVLASYGQVIVVTVNYRLGVLGFMRPSIDEHNIANYALLDQIAALHWIKENIGSFGGDNSRVTLMGHSTGAACVNYLMVSPVASGLFHRAILMSGSAMSDWAASNRTLELTMQIAHSLDCPLGGNGAAGDDDDDALLECLRQRRYQDILHIPTTFQQFSTSLGPIVDGHVIPNQPYKVMGHYTEHFSRYDLLFGITESESYHTLAALALEKGLGENERDNLLRRYMKSRFDVRPDLALAATLKKYQDMYNNPINATNLEHRDVVLDILSDARVVGPLLQTGLFHADVNRRNYMYVFGHNSATGPYANLPHSIMGEELAFIFGAPLAPAGPFSSHNYSVQEKLLSEAVMAYWTNFVKTGNPKAPWQGTFINSHALEWDRYDLDWPEFNKRGQAYLNIGIPPTVGYKYRQIYMNFWNKELPDELNQIAAIQEQHQQPGSEVITGHMSKYGTRDNGAEDPVRTLKLLLQDPLAGGDGELTPVAAENMYNAPPTFGHVNKQHQQQEGTTSSDVEQQSQAAVDDSVGNGENGGATGSDPVAKSETTLQLLIALIAVFIVLNLVIYATFLLQKRRKRVTSLQRKLGGILSYDGATDDELKRTASKSHDGDDSYILDMVRKTNTYEAIKTAQRSPINGYGITRQLSSSTVDTHTKVCEWMSGHGLGGHTLPKSSSPAFSSLSGSFASKPAHGQPSQCLDGRIIICQDIEVTDADLLTPQHMHESEHNFHYELLLQRQNSALTEPSDVPLPPQYQHQHSRSDPVDMILNQHLTADEQVTSFVHADDVDINVTSRDDSKIEQVLPLTAAQQLELLRQRNYPKVLPTTTSSGAQRDSDSPPMTIDLSRSYKRNSLPPQSYSFGAPLPPPRSVSSTLGRQTSRRRDSSNITTSPLMLAQDCGEDDGSGEVKITENTLIVGPIVPKSPKSTKAPKTPTMRAEPVPSTLSQPAAGGKLSGSFQSFESVPPPHEATPPHMLPGTAQRTERIYAIQPTTTAATMPAVTPTTPTTPNWPAPNGALYAQPQKSASKTSLIPKMLPQAGRERDAQAGGEVTETTATAADKAEAAGAAEAAATAEEEAEVEARVTAAAVCLPQTRIPQLQRNSMETAKDKGTTAAAATTIATAIETTTPKTNAARSVSAISGGSTSSWCSSNSSSHCSSTASTSSSSSTGTVRTELQQSQHQPSKSITTNI